MVSQELIYTSATKGLKLGSRGFCTVASTSGMAKNLADRLEALSGYKHVFPPGDPQAQRNPVNNSYLRFKMGGRVFYLLSRIADAGLDYTQRTNKIAHHIVLSREELAMAGPAWVASQVGFFETTWKGEPRILPASRTIPQSELRTGVCNTWARLAGDAGWAGVLAESFLKRTSSEAYLICKPGTDALSLFLEAQALLPTEKRWDVTFSTYFSKVPPGVECRWRCVMDGTPEAVLARRSPEKLVIDLTAPLAPAEGGLLVVAARTGAMPQAVEVETAQLVEPSVVEKKIPSVPPSVPWQDVPELEALPPALPQQRRNTSVPRNNFAKKENSIWKVAALAALVLLTFIVGTSIRFFWPAPQSPRVASADKKVDDPQVALSDATAGGKGGNPEMQNSGKGSSSSNHGDNSSKGEKDKVVDEASTANENMEEDDSSRQDKHQNSDQHDESQTTSEKNQESTNPPQKPQAPPKDVLSAIAPYVVLPEPIGSSATIQSSKFLGCFPSKYSNQLELVLIGVPDVDSLPKIRLFRNDDDNSKWQLSNVSEGIKKPIAEITMSPLPEGSNSTLAELTFDWDSKASKPALKSVIIAVRHSGIRFQIGDAQPMFLCFRPADFQTSKPKDTLQLKNKVLLPEDSIPLGQTAVLQYRTSISIDGTISDSETQKWIFDDKSQPPPIDFKLGELKLQVTCKMDFDHKIKTSFTLVRGDKAGKNLDNFLEDLWRKRKELFLDAISARIDVLKYIQAQHEIKNYLGFELGKMRGWKKTLVETKDVAALDAIWSTLENKWRNKFPKARGKFLDSIREKIQTSGTRLSDAKGGIQPISQKGIDKLREIISEAKAQKKRLEELESKAQENSKLLSDHQNDFPHLVNWLKTKETLKIHLQISRQLSIPGEENQDMFPLVPIYRAGTPIESKP